MSAHPNMCSSAGCRTASPTTSYGHRYPVVEVTATKTTAAPAVETAPAPCARPGARNTEGEPIDVQH